MNIDNRTAAMKQPMTMMKVRTIPFIGLPSIGQAPAQAASAQR